MTVAPKWISKKALLLLHEESLAQFGGARGLRDEARCSILRLRDWKICKPASRNVRSPISQPLMHSG